MKFTKYQALGNDYLVLDLADWGSLPDEAAIRRICDRHYGAGSDGILWGPLAAPEADYGLRIFNPDGSPVEISGNGLRIFCRCLWDGRLVGEAPFRLQTAVEQGQGLAWLPPVTCQVAPGGGSVRIEMGRVSFDSQSIPVAGAPRQVLNETMEIGGQSLTFCAATLGNPHCVVLRQQVSREEACRLGPLIETDARFPRRTNVQFMRIVDRHAIHIEIWERGAGYTLASGSSSCAAAAVAVRLGACDSPVSVRMPGGLLQVELNEDFDATLTGPVRRVMEGSFDGAIFE